MTGPKLDPLAQRGLAHMAVQFAPNLAETVEQLWHVLLNVAGAPEPFPLGAARLLSKHHRRGDPDALTTTLLLCTDRRWEPCMGHLMKDIVDEGVLTDEQLEGLARLFLAHDTMSFDHPTANQGFERIVRPPLRRWATGYLLRRRKAGFLSMLRQAQSSKPDMGAAIVAGMLDAICAIDPHWAPAALELGLTWPLGAVRRQALEILAANGGVEEAVQRAAADPDAKVRRWKPRRADPPESRADAGQQSLFDGV